jgi:NitT/TauT family transport system permease protein
MPSKVNFNSWIPPLSVAIIIAIWYLFSLSGLPFLPSPALVFRRLLILLFSGQILPDLSASLMRLFLSFFGALALGVPLGLLMGYLSFFYQLLRFPVDFFRSVPATALFPLFMLFFGVGDFTKIVLIIFSCALIMIVHTAAGVRQSAKVRRLAAQTMGANKFQIFKKVIFYDALPEIATGIKIILSFSLVLVIVLEMFIGTKQGLGRRIYDFHLSYRIADMYGLIILVGVIGYFLNRLIRLFEKKVFHWFGK